MDNNKRLTPEEMSTSIFNYRMNRGNLQYIMDTGRLNGTMLSLNVEAMRAFATQEVEFAKQSMWDNGANVCISTTMYHGMAAELIEKDALLKEAYTLIANAMYLSNNFEEKRRNWINKITTGSEVDKHESK